MTACKARGHLLVEFLFGCVLVGAVLPIALAFGKVAAHRRRALMAADVGARLLSSGRVAPDVAEESAAAVLSALAPDLASRADVRRIRFTATPSSRFYELVGTEVRWRERLPGAGGETPLVERVVAEAEHP